MLKITELSAYVCFADIAYLKCRLSKIIALYKIHIHANQLLHLCYTGDGILLTT